ncbi:MAG: glutamate--cysteine ligase [Candidatus Pelagadaptatus aseana]|uniref:glutamate--cysteine ligase n=1 Tax=Candidatus Pelagadaptatus aseana TaxID=3120508 RepID=UPI0039B1671B
MSLLSQRLALLSESGNEHLTRIFKGLEKESLRVDGDGQLSQQPHPEALGSALTHPAITTDYSEALLEFITDPTEDTEQLLADLDAIQHYTYKHLPEGESLWVASMPCMLTQDKDIPVARYGDSNVGTMKTVYRLGLGERYGRTMQTIAGVHYNFSLGEEFWEFWFRQEAGAESLQQYKNRRYLDLIRNFRGNFWLLLYLFGASPAVCRSFVRDREHQLQAFGADDHSLHAPFATTLRMGDLGYQSSAQSSLLVCYNDLNSYIQTLCGAITQPHDDYVDKGLYDAAGEYHQLNTSLLQIENEFYSTIRPKRTIHTGETALSALATRGIEYIEVRCVDLNPYEPLGVNAEQLYFMDVFLLYCLLVRSPEASPEKYQRELENQRLMVYRGRDPEMKLNSEIGQQSLAQWGKVLLREMGAVAKILDRSYSTSRYSEAVKAQLPKLQDASLTPSARMLEDMQREDKTFFRLMMDLSQEQAATYQAKPLAAGLEAQMAQQAEDSLQAQSQLESESQPPFADYLKNYYAQYQCCQG